LGSDSAAGRGLKKFVAGTFKYTNLPAHIEDFARATGYVNARRMGHLPDDASQLVNKALFDYMHGLSQFEQRWVKRLVPFYSYQRFAIPMMAKVFASTPGRVTNLAKASESFFRVWDKIASNDELTQEEREVLPGWLLEQPRAFHGFTQLMQAEFKTFNNYSPLDVMGFVAAHDEGDERGMLTKFGLAQLTPFVKVPIETMMGRDAFSGRRLTDTKRDVGPIDPDEFTMQAAAATMAGITGRPEFIGLVGASAAGFNPGSAEFNRKILEVTLGYEEGINKTTGERTAYMSPYRVHLMTSFAPGLNEIFKLSRDDRTPLQKTMYGLFGIGTVELDLQQEQYRREQELTGRGDFTPPPKNTLKGLEYRLKWAEERELHDQAQRYREELEEFLDRMEDRSMELEGHVRGGGM
jgi:hypothetical protein